MECKETFTSKMKGDILNSKHHCRIQIGWRSSYGRYNLYGLMRLVTNRVYWLPARSAWSLPFTYINWKLLKVIFLCLIYLLMFIAFEFALTDERQHISWTYRQCWSATLAPFITWFVGNCIWWQDSTCMGCSDSKTCCNGHYKRFQSHYFGFFGKCVKCLDNLCFRAACET